MTIRNIWIFYNKPPLAVTSTVGKFFIHNKHSVEVKILSFHPLVGHMISADKDKLFGNLPSMTVPMLSFEVLSGEAVGQVLFMASENFFSQFNVKE